MLNTPGHRLYCPRRLAEDASTRVARTLYLVTLYLVAQRHTQPDYDRLILAATLVGGGTLSLGGSSFGTSEVVPVPRTGQSLSLD